MKEHNKLLLLMLGAFLEFIYFTVQYLNTKSNFHLILLFITGLITVFLNIKFQKSLRKYKEDFKKCNHK